MKILTFYFPSVERPVTDVDVVFALGASGHHGDEVFEKEKDFVNGFVDSSKHGNMEYAMIQYVDPLTVHFRLVLGKPCRRDRLEFYLDDSCDRLIETLRF